MRRFIPVVTAVSVLALAACAPLTPVGIEDSAVVVTSEEFLGGQASPTPEATVTARPESWEGAAIPDGYRIALVAADEDRAARTLASSISAWAAGKNAHVASRTVSDERDMEAIVNAVVDDAPDLVVAVGDGLIDMLSLLTAQHLSQQFLLVGAQLPEPTANVTAVVWDGAAFRGTGISDPDAVRQGAVTSRRAVDGVAAGIVSVRAGLTGIVVWLP